MDQLTFRLYSSYISDSKVSSYFEYCNNKSCPLSLSSFSDVSEVEEEPEEVKQPTEKQPSQKKTGIKRKSETERPAKAKKKTDQVFKWLFCGNIFSRTHCVHFIYLRQNVESSNWNSTVSLVHGFRAVGLNRGGRGPKGAHRELPGRPWDDYWIIESIDSITEHQNILFN